jgi:hypothetical protein
MPRSRAGLLVVASACLAAAVACAEPPDKEIQQAIGAIDAARAAGAAEYAAEEFTAAQDALARANDAVELRDYRLALNHALDSRERAQNAAKMAADGKALARVDADRALSRLAAALMDAQAKLEAAEGARVAARSLAAPRGAIADSERRVQEARAAFERDDYAAVMEAEMAVTKALADAAAALETAARPAARRRR